tara:strand:- start:1749 stop:2060 length:312 start_codon:yes stop_codon:yes gene_type:complete
MLGVIQIVPALEIVIKVVTVHAEEKMGFRKPMDYSSVHHQIYMAGVEMHSSYNDGFTTWEIKKDLHRLKWLLDEIMADSPTFADEQEFLDEHSKVKMWRTLKK